MMKRYLFILICLLACVVASAKQVTESEALQKAQSFMQGKKFVMPEMSRRRAAHNQIAQAYYVFNIEDQGGFVIVSGDDRMPEILGYSEKGNLNLAKAPCNLKWLLSYYEQVIGSINEDEAKPRVKRAEEATKNPVTPLIVTEWGQGEPYNGLCPSLDGSACITGCVATAMAQVINYNRWPQGQTSSVAAYQTKTSHINMPQLEPTTFNWDNLNAIQIARLMLYCGQAVQMDYGTSASGAYESDVAPALINVFGYSRNARLLRRNSFEDAAWEDQIYEELSAGRPVIYFGDGSDGGHSFIVCGYKDQMFYVNWGWDGNCDGFFALSNLTPGNSMNFSADQTAIVGIQPPADAGDISRPKAVVQQMTVSEKNLTRESASEAFPTITIGSRIESDLSEDATIQIGLGLYDENGLRKVLANSQHLFTGDTYQYDADITFDKDLPEGEYTIKAINRMTDADDWLTDAGASDRYVSVSVGETEMKLQAWPKTSEEQYYEDLGIHTIDGVTYHLVCEYENYRAKVLPFQETEKYEGEVYVPDYVTYSNMRYQVFGIENAPFSDCPELTALSVGYGVNYNRIYIDNCPKLTNLELREGMIALGNINRCGIETLTLPASLSILSSLPSGKSLTSIRFQNTRKIKIDYMNGDVWSQNNAPSLTDVYFASDYPPEVENVWGEIEVNPNVTIHIPQGTLDTYKQSIWKDWNLMEDQPAIPVSVIWDYSGNDENASCGMAVGRGENDVEFAMCVPASHLTAYTGCKVTRIEFYSCPPSINDWHMADVEYVFLTKPGTDYIAKVPLTTVRGTWNTVELPEPYIITGDQLFVGYGRNKSLEAEWANLSVVDEGFYLRVMGSDYSWGMENEVGIWQKHAGINDWNHPLPIRFYIEGEKLPTDVVIGESELIDSSEGQDTPTYANAQPIQFVTATPDGYFTFSSNDKGQFFTAANGASGTTPAKAKTILKKAPNGKMQLKTTVRSRTPEIIKSLKIDWSIDGTESGSQTFETSLLPNHEETFIIALPSSIQGRNHTIMVDVAEINGKPDEIKANSTAEVAIVMPAATHYPRKVVMEEGTGTWCGWCVRGIETIERMKKEYPDNFIAIGVHYGDQMEGAINYDKLLARFDSYPNSFINRTKQMDPSYWEVKEFVENNKENGDAKITAKAFFATADSSAVKVETESVFGFSDPNTSDYRVAFVVVEDQVGPYVQNNFYSDATAPHTDDLMDEWIHKDAQVNMLFNDVARGIYSDYHGNAKSFTIPITEGETYNYQYTFTLPKNIQNKKNIHIITLLLDNKNGEILNADQTTVEYDKRIDSKTFGFAYQGDEQPDGGLVTISAEEDDYGFGEMNCETNPSTDPKNGLVVKTKDGKKKSGTAKLEIVSNTIGAKNIQWCMGGECVLMNNKNSLEKTFTTDENGIAQVQFDAMNVSNYGELEAILTVTIGNETSNINILFSYEEEPVEPTDIYYRGTQLNTGTQYSSDIFSDIKSGIFKISKDKKKLTLNNLTIECEAKEDDGNLFQMNKATTVVLKGKNSLSTPGYYVMNPRSGTLTITGSGSLTTQSNWYDFWITGCEMTIDNTTLESKGYISIGDNSAFDGDNLIVKKSTFKGRRLYGLTGLTLINCAFKSSQEIIIEPDEYHYNLKYADGSYVQEFTIEPIEGDFGNIVTPMDFGRIYVEKGKSREVAITMSNGGTNAVKSISYVITNDGKQEAEQTYKLETPITKIGSTFEVPVTFEGASKLGVADAMLTVTKVNGEENTAKKNTATGSIVTVGEAVSHAVVVEEFTGTWCQWCTRGIVGLDLMKKTFGDQVITIAAHDGDPMYAEDYGFIFRYSAGFPSCVINRGETIDPYWGTNLSSKPFGIEADIEKELAIPVVGSIQPTATWTNKEKTAINIKTATTFVVDDDSAPYQIGFILIEDGMRGAGSEWAQQNAYTGYSGGDENLRVMGAKPSPITNMEYNHVAVAAWGADKGLSGSVSSPIRADVPQVFTCVKSIADNQLIQDKEKLSVVALLLDKNTGKIINAAECKIGESSPDPDPNGISIIYSDDENAVWYDMNGTRLENTPNRKGVYIKNGKKVIR